MCGCPDVNVCHRKVLAERLAQLEVADVLPNGRPCDGPWPELPARRRPSVVALLVAAPSPICDTDASALGPHDTTTVIGIIPGGVS